MYLSSYGDLLQVARLGFNKRAHNNCEAHPVSYQMATDSYFNEVEVTGAMKLVMQLLSSSIEHSFTPLFFDMYSRQVLKSKLCLIPKSCCLFNQHCDSYRYV